MASLKLRYMCHEEPGRRLCTVSISGPNRFLLFPFKPCSTPRLNISAPDFKQQSLPQLPKEYGHQETGLSSLQDLMAGGMQPRTGYCSGHGGVPAPAQRCGEAPSHTATLAAGTGATGNPKVHSNFRNPKRKGFQKWQTIGLQTTCPSPTPQWAPPSPRGSSA